jgi:translation initiation factor 2 alpha subunit (eIF-2alpha)
MSGRIKHQDIFVALRKAGLTQHFEYRSPIEYDSSRRLEHFVELIAAKAAAAEREACAEICDRLERRYGEGPELEHWAQGFKKGASVSAKKIRARGDFS